MALPTVTLTGTYVRPDGTPIRGWVDFCPPSVLTFSDEPTFVACCTRVHLDENGQFSVDLLATDAPGSNIEDDDWFYHVSERLQCEGGERDYFIALPMASSPIDLAQIAPTTRPPNLNYLRLPGPEGPPGGPAPDGAVDRSGDTMTGPLLFDTQGVDVDVQQAFSGSLSTGILNGGRISPGPTDTTLFLEALEGYVVDTFTDPFSPTVRHVQASDQVIELDAGSQSRGISWFLMDADGDIIQQADRPSPAQRRNLLMLGGIAYNSGTQQFILVQSIPTILSQPANQLLDLMDALGPFTIHGLAVRPNGTNLSLNLTAGSMFAPGFSHYVDSALTQNPHYVDAQARNAFVFRRISRVFTGAEDQVTTLDPTLYDNNGVLTSVGGGSGSSTVQRVWMAGNGLVGNDIVIQYGQQVHSSLTGAVAAIGGTNFVGSEGVIGNAALLGYIAMTRTATDLSDTSQAVFVHAGKFATP